MAAAAAGFPAWAATPSSERARAARTRRRAARERIAAGCSRCCRTRAARRSTMRSPNCARRSTIAAITPRRRARALAPQPMPGPTGESNVLRYRGRGVFVCISPWNFPLAIFLGQVAAALAAGNAVVAKPAEQTPLVAARAVALLHEAGMPATRAASRARRRRRWAQALSPIRASPGSPLPARPKSAAPSTARSPQKSGPIVPLIAETGGINAMIVDATALPEQVTDDVVASAFRSAGQRCSALRLLCLQEDVADRMLDMLIGAARELKVGDPRDSSTHIGPVIDAEAKAKLESWIAAMERRGPRALPLRRRSGAARPTAPMWRRPSIELDRRLRSRREVFGPVLHVVRWRAGQLDALLDEIAANGTALTLGIHSRIDLTVERIAARLAARQCLRQPQHDRRRGRHPAVRRHVIVGHRPQGRRAELSAPLRHRAGGDRSTPPRPAAMPAFWPRTSSQAVPMLPN